MGTPTNNGTRTIRVSLETHKAVMDLADRLDGSADDALNHLIGASTVRVPVSDIQRQRWSRAAHDAGVSLPEFVKMRVEAALQWGGDPGVLGTIYDQIIKVCQHTGMRRRVVDQSTRPPQTG
jgi:hypothetical protein